MEAHLEENLTLERIAAEAGFSAYHFHRVFRRHTGLSIGDYLRARRLSLASRLLLESDRSILDLALDCRFESQEAFTRAFKKQYGLPPGRYRKLFRIHNRMRERMMERMSAQQQASMESPLKGWFLRGSQPQHYRIDLDRSIIHQGEASGLLKSKSHPEAGGFGTLMQQFKADAYRGKRMRFSGFLRTRGVTEFCGLWMRVDNAEEEMLQFDNMSDRPLSGDTEWNHYPVVLDVPLESAVISFGVLLSGEGEVWIDSLRFEKVDLSVPVTSLDTTVQLPDHPMNLQFEE
ncbi:AraC family transcriptional regulator [Paenibacillus pasadenensis]|nr:AraC family transcriptional regulator [Paenibacillus pasadenensis]MCM3750039.1 AraC family transcriptional regulator [Paenibacillus pasadenensis]